MITRYAFAGTLLAAAALTTSAAKPESKGPEPDAILKELYKAHHAHKGPFFDRENRAALEQYFTKELAALIAKDAKESEGEVGAIEFDPLYASQDPQVKNFKIGAVQSRGEGHALVSVTFKDNGKQRELRFAFEQQADKPWRISDIHYPDDTALLELLRRVYSSRAER